MRSDGTSPVHRAPSPSREGCSTFAAIDAGLAAARMDAATARTASAAALASLIAIRTSTAEELNSLATSIAAMEKRSASASASKRRAERAELEEAQEEEYELHLSSSELITAALDAFLESRAANAFTAAELESALEERIDAANAEEARLRVQIASSAATQDATRELRAEVAALKAAAEAAAGSASIAAAAAAARSTALAARAAAAEQDAADARAGAALEKEARVEAEAAVIALEAKLADAAAERAKVALARPPSPLHSPLRLRSRSPLSQSASSTSPRSAGTVRSTSPPAVALQQEEEEELALPQVETSMLHHHRDTKVPHRASKGGGVLVSGATLPLGWRDDDHGERRAGSSALVAGTTAPRACTEEAFLATTLTPPDVNNFKKGGQCQLAVADLRKKIARELQEKEIAEFALKQRIKQVQRDRVATHRDDVTKHAELASEAASLAVLLSQTQEEKCALKERGDSALEAGQKNRHRNVAADTKDEKMKPVAQKIEGVVGSIRLQWSVVPEVSASGRRVYEYVVRAYPALRRVPRRRRLRSPRSQADLPVGDTSAEAAQEPDAQAAGRSGSGEESSSSPSPTSDDASDTDVEDADDARHVCMRIKAKRFQTTYTALISGCEESGDIKHKFTVTAVTRSGGVTGATSLASEAVAAYSREENWRIASGRAWAAERFLKWPVRRHSKPFVSNSFSCCECIDNQFSLYCITDDSPKAFWRIHNETGFT